MIVYQRYPGAWYADALPDRTFAVLFPQTVTIDTTGRVRVTTEGWMQTHLGPIMLPVADEPLYHRITNTSGFQIAGQAHFSLQTWVWTSIGWRSTIPACGVSPVIYDKLGILHISDCSIGSQGWRYVQDDGTSTGRLVTGDNTYGPLHALNEFTDLGGGIIVGQGNPDAGAPMAAALVWDGSRHRLLEDGPCRFIRVTRAGDRVAVATWKEGFGAVLAWLTLADLLELPVVAAPTPKPAPVPPPTPAPPPPKPPAPKPLPAPKPPPAPKPSPEPTKDPMPDPTYDQFVKEESHDVRTAYKDAIGREPAVDDYYHNAWRRLVERWTHRDILHDIRHEPLEDGGAGGADHPP